MSMKGHWVHATPLSVVSSETFGRRLRAPLLLAKGTAPVKGA
jgi:hypothetical protein